MPTAHRLPSGSWRCQVTVAGSRRSVTADTKKEAELAAADLIRRGTLCSVPSSIAFSDAVDQFMADKSKILSPSTWRSYDCIRRNNLAPIRQIRLASLTSGDVQRLINQLSGSHTPKTVRNVYGLISAVIRYTRPDLRLDVRLPAPRRHEMVIPTNAQIAPLLTACTSNQNLYIAVTLAISAGLRLSEICALTWSDIDFTTGALSVTKALVKAKGNTYTVKQPKSAAGYRVIHLPPASLRILKQFAGDPSARLITCTPHAIEDAFRKVTRANGYAFRFHDLRHYYASVLLSLNIPNKYSMALMGHSSEYTLQHVYQHLMADRQDDVTAAISGHFSTVL